MHIQLNGDSHELAAESTLLALTDNLSLTGKRIAIEVNEELVPRGEHASFTLSEGDKVEIVQAIGGG